MGPELQLMPDQNYSFCEYERVSPFIFIYLFLRNKYCERRNNYLVFCSMDSCCLFSIQHFKY